MTDGGRTSRGEDGRVGFPPAREIGDGLLATHGYDGITVTFGGDSPPLWTLTLRGDGIGLNPIFITMTGRRGNDGGGAGMTNGVVRQVLR